MALQIGQIAPDFEADTTEGHIHFHEWLGDSWGVLFSHPKNFTPVCTTELGAMARPQAGVRPAQRQVLGLRVDPVDDHNRWAQDIKDATGSTLEYPADRRPDLKIAKLYGMLPSAPANVHRRTPADNATVRNVFVIGAGQDLKLS